ncbi:MAG: helix-turn-helix transcriptional regulator [bacterium]
MQEPIVCIFCDQPALKIKLKYHLENHYRLLFSETRKGLLILLKANEIACLVGYPFQDGVCNLWQFREIKNKFETIPFIFICPYYLLEFVRACADTLADEVVSLDKIDQIPAQVQSVINRFNFQQQLLLTDGQILRSPPRVKKAIKIIQSSFMRIKFAEEVSRPLGISVITFRKEFKQSCGTSFTQYLIQLKLHYAAYLGQNEGLLAKDIAHHSGFQDEHEFYRCFKRKIGMPFSEFRAKYTFQEFNQFYDKNSKN